MENVNAVSNPTRKRKGGRPRLPVQERRDFQYKVGFKQAEHENLERRAQAAGLPAPEFIRLTSLGVDLPKAMPQVNKDALVHLGKIGGLLNQIAKHLNTGAGSDQDKEHLALASKALAGLQTRILDAQPLAGGDQ